MDRGTGSSSHGGAAECGPGVNALSKLSKQLDGSMLQQQGLHTTPLGKAGPSSMAVMRQRSRMGLEHTPGELTQEFLYGNPPIQHNPGAFNFTGVQRELEAVYPRMAHEKSQHYASDHLGSDWASEFPMNNRAGNTMHPHQLAEFEELYLRGTEMRPSWGSEFQGQQFRATMQSDAQNLNHIGIDSEAGREFEEAFIRAKESATWTSEFVNTNTSTAWEAEFEKTQQADISSGVETVDAADGADAISKTAGMLLDIVGNVDNIKFKQSKFVEFIQQLHHQELLIEDGKVVKPIHAVADRGPKAWADAFLESHEDDHNAGPRAVGWEEDFNLANQGQTANHSWAEEFAPRSDLHDGSWAQEFTSSEYSQHPMNVDKSIEGESMSSHEWSEQFSKHIQQQPAVLEGGDDMMWDQHMNTAWMQQQDSVLPPSESNLTREAPLTDIASLGVYEFTPNNPYLGSSFSLEFLQSPKNHQNLTESIMALEAAVQRDPTHANTWRYLGERQQENENDSMAIRALLRCTDLDSGNTAALLALSVSYTNEGLPNEAYEALNNWIAHNPLYEQFAGVPWSGLDSADSIGVLAASDKHAIVTDKFISAASVEPGDGLDEDVQVGLGVLFNISAEYSKAVDCFRAALVKRPNDYMLWNKLGASLANSHDPRSAMDAYFTALNINPSYIRARYNLAIACLQIGQYREAAEHLLGALSVQNHNMTHVMNLASKGGVAESSDSLLNASLGPQSHTLWSTLRMLADTYLNRSDLVSVCDQRNLSAFHNEFDF
ncbi:hypothetical protein BASA81_004268 [Batrachochytrium salamandrivorans]|nr:hypothetical protein BASA81_004268 [Batrachochytrium salamandrivorans]